MRRMLPIAGLLVLSLTGCEPETISVALPFQAVFGNVAASCAESTAGGRMTDLRFYLSNVRLLRSDGKAIAVTLIPNDRWQGNGIALIDLEDAGMNCPNGTPDMNDSLLGNVPDATYRGISFTIGVPFEFNHIDPLTAPAPLDDSTMHWHWQSGYKFLRAGVAAGRRDHWIHLGSAGCEGSIRSISHCRYPNRFNVTIAEYVPGDSLIVDIGELLEAYSRHDTAESNCSSGPSELSCAEVFDVFGLEHSSGVQTRSQRLIRLLPR